MVEEQRKGHSFAGEDGVGDSFVGCCFQCVLFVHVYLCLGNLMCVHSHAYRPNVSLFTFFFGHFPCFSYAFWICFWKG